MSAHQLYKLFDLLHVTAHALVISVNARDRFVEELKRLVILVFTKQRCRQLVPLAVYDEDSHYLLQFVRVVFTFELDIVSRLPGQQNVSEVCKEHGCSAELTRQVLRGVQREINLIGIIIRV